MRSLILLITIAISGMNFAWSANYKPADFAKLPAYYDAKISPTGEYIAMGMIREGERVLGVWDIKANKMVGGAQFSYPKQTGDFFWVNDERLVIQLVHSRATHPEPGYYGELYAVNYDGSQPKMIYGYAAADRDASTRLNKRDSTRGWAFIESFLTGDDRHILINSVPMSRDRRKHSTLEKLNIYNGKMTKVMTSPTISYSYHGFSIDSNHNPRFFVGLNKEGDRDFYEYNLEDETWGPVTGIELTADFWPLALGKDDKSLYYFNNDEAGIKGIYKYYLESGKSKKIYVDDKVDILEVNYNDDMSSVYALSIANGYTDYLVLDKHAEEAEILRGLLGTFAGNEIRVTSSTKDRNVSTVFVSSDTDAGMFYLFDRSKNSLSGLFPVYNNISAKDMAKSTPYNVKVSDDMEVPVYLTLPKNAKGKRSI